MKHAFQMIIGMGIAAALAGPAVADEFFTSFEFTDRSGDFTLSTEPNTVVFLNGEAKSVGNFGLYHSGIHSFMVDVGKKATIFFQTPAESIDLWFRDQFSTTDGVLRVFGDMGVEIATFNGTIQWQNVVLSGVGPISHMTLENSGTRGYSVIDDFSFCAGIEGRTPIENPIPREIPFGDIRIKLSLIAEGLTAPNWGTPAPGDSANRLFVTDQDGILWEITLSTLERRAFLDVSDRIVKLGIGGKGTFDERGLLGVAFHPDYQTNGLFYTYESHPDSAEPDFSTIPKGESPNHQTVITEWMVPNPGDPDSLPDMNSAREIMRIDQPQFNHNAGAMAFGPDDMLYIALGDGGAGDDQGLGHVAGGNGMDENNILGSLIRIDPLGNDSANGQYGIPADNPFVDLPGVNEIFAYGFRNPFRFSFDMQTGDIWLGDAGQNDIEEVDIVVSGGNYGWRIKEGSFYFDSNGSGRGFVFLDAPGLTPPLIDPVAQYDHDEGVVVVGGFVHRGASSSPLFGRYISGEFAETFQNDGRVFYLDDQNEFFETRYFALAGFGRSLLGFGQDAAGEVYVMANSTGTPFEETGVVLRIVALERAPLQDLQMVTGSIRSGDLESLREVDDVDLQTRSGFGRTFTELHKMEMIVGSTTQVNSPDLLDVAVVARIDHPSGTQRISLRNWNTGDLDIVATDTIGETEETFMVEDIDATNYVRPSDGRTEVSVKHLVFVPFLAFQFDSFIDLVEVGVR